MEKNYKEIIEIVTSNMDDNGMVDTLGLIEDIAELTNVGIADIDHFYEEYKTDMEFLKEDHQEEIRQAVDDALEEMRLSEQSEYERQQFN